METPRDRFLLSSRVCRRPAYLESHCEEYDHWRCECCWDLSRYSHLICSWSKSSGVACSRPASWRHNRVWLARVWRGTHGAALSLCSPPLTRVLRESPRLTVSEVKTGAELVNVECLLCCCCEREPSESVTTHCQVSALPGLSNTGRRKSSSLRRRERTVLSRPAIL